MKTVLRCLVLVVVASGLLIAAHPCPARGQMTAEVLPLNTMVTVKAPVEPVNRATVYKKVLRYCSFESQKISDYVRVFRFPVTPGQKYTFYDCHPAPSDGAQIWIYLSGDTPLTNDTHSYGPSTGYTRGFVTRGQQPWPMKRGEKASCDLARHNITIAPQSEHNDLYVIVSFRKSGASTRIMLKQPADSDDVVSKSADRSRGTVWKAPFLLTNIPGGPAGTQKPPALPPQPTGSTPGTVAPPPPGPDSSQPPRSGIVKEAPTTTGNATVIPYNSTVHAYINRSDYDAFRFYFPGGRMRIASQGGLDIVADLLDSKGMRLARDGQDARKDFLIEADLPAGTYYIQIRYMYHAGEGPYTLILGNGASAVLKEADR